MLSEQLKKIIESEIDLISACRFDELFKKYKPSVRMQLIELFLTAGITFGSTSGTVKFKQKNIANFLNDIRFEKSDVSIRKGPINTSDLKVDDTQYVVRFKENRTMFDIEPNKELPLIFSKYNIDKITETWQYVSRAPGKQVGTLVVIFNT